ncbi:hypothetical protein SteCoe_8441 [Stentor coeruleus]|uniref:VWFA domain-containing protein n=1 Tax=Stentor coeruleus TaxID=5963 RepID=A0A1R2CKC6_9CILI|nr:hypothetical protein SteCoe_8441 [Stentor coeruleus]
MKVSGLRKKISLVVITPLLIGIILTMTSSMFPLWFYYPKMLETYTDKMISNQRNSILQVSSLISNTTSTSYIQVMLNSVIIVSDIIEGYLFYSLNAKTSLNRTAIYQNAFNYNEEYQQKKSSESKNYNISTWYSPQNFTETKEKTNLDYSLVFNTVIKAISLSTQNINETFSSTYIVYQNDGLFYRFPALYVNYSEYGCVSNKYSNYNSQVYSKNCSGITNCTTCSYCKNSSLDFEPYYDSRCRIFFKITNNYRSTNALITPPYIFQDIGLRGQSTCRGQWNFTTDQLVLVYCADYLLNDKILEDILFIPYGNKAYSYILDTNGNIIYYKNNLTLTPTMNITDLECDSEEEKKYYRKHILPLFMNERTEVKNYKKNGDEMMIAVTPVMMIINSQDTKLHHMGSVGVVMKKSEVESIFDSLRSKLNSILGIYIYLNIGLLVIIAILSVIWTYKITGSILYPIDHLLIILKRMINQDLDIDILESYKPSPPEIATLYKVFDELRVVMRFSNLKSKDAFENTLVISQALNLFTKFGNKKGMEICYMRLGDVFYKGELWEESVEYLDMALKLADELGQIEKFTKAKMKAELANAMIKTGKNIKEALVLLNSALEFFTNHGKEEELLLCVLEITEELYEKKIHNYDLVKFIENYLSCFSILDKNILMQRFLYIKGLICKNNGETQDACWYFVSVLEDFPVYLPSIRNRAIIALNEIFNYYLVKCPKIKVFQNKASDKKDVILIVSSNLYESYASFILRKHIKSILKEDDRISLLQFHSERKIIFNLTKLPENLLHLRKFNIKTDKVLLYDSILLGFRQLSLNNGCSQSEDKRQEWMIIVTDLEDRGSIASFEEVCNKVKDSGINLIIISMILGYKKFEELIDNVKCGLMFYIKDDQDVDLVFSELEATLCSEKEVYLPLYEEVKG